jgi:hypothetical protein
MSAVAQDQAKPMQHIHPKTRELFGKALKLDLKPKHSLQTMMVSHPHKVCKSFHSKHL